MANVTAKGTWQAPLRQLNVSVVSRGPGKTSYTVSYRTADKGDAKDVTATLTEGEWPKGISSKEDGIRALIAICIALDRTFLPPKG